MSNQISKFSIHTFSDAVPSKQMYIHHAELYALSYAPYGFYGSCVYAYGHQTAETHLSRQAQEAQEAQEAQPPSY
jgi:hypothetical protein